MRLYFALMAIAQSIVVAVPVWAAPLLDDHFDDGDLATNTTGTGAGFTTFATAGTITESASEVVFDLTPFALHSIYSNDNLNLFSSAGTTTTFHVSGGATADNVPLDFPAGDNGRIWLGLVTDTTNSGSFALPIDSTPGRHGLWVSLYDTIDADPFFQATLGAGTNPNDYNGQVGWVDADGNRAILAQFTYDSYLINDPAHNVIDVVMTVTDTTYTVSFGGPDAGVTVQNGTLSGNLPSAATGNFKVAATIQSGGQASSLHWELDRIGVQPAAVLGDVNFDGVVDIFDVNVVSDNWGAAGPTGDANSDGTVDIFDVNVISDNWTTSGAAAVPEPGSLALAALVALTGSVWMLRRPKTSQGGQ